LYLWRPGQLTDYRLIVEESDELTSRESSSESTEPEISESQNLNEDDTSLEPNDASVDQEQSVADIPITEERATMDEI